jgi:hypothetical protein
MLSGYESVDCKTFKVKIGTGTWLEVGLVEAVKNCKAASSKIKYRVQTGRLTRQIRSESASILSKESLQSLLNEVNRGKRNELTRINKSTENQIIS